jgi:glucosamine--fructose-6-phosphate aminotransferase (isomerizing)
LVIINKDEPEKLAVCRNGSPILIGFSNSAIYVASEVKKEKINNPQSIAFEKYTRNYIKLEDKEIVYIDLKNKQEFYKNVHQRIQTVNFVDAQTKPKAPYKTFFEQEIMEQPEALMKCMSNGARLAGEPGSSKLGGFEEHKEELIGIKHLMIVACGTSYYAALYGARMFKLLGCFDTVQVFIASELTEEDFPESDAGVLAIS